MAEARVFRFHATVLGWVLVSWSSADAQPVAGGARRAIVLPAQAQPMRATVKTVVDGDRLNAGRVVAIVADRRGVIYVADDRKAEVGVFDSSGRSVRTMGRRGQGPGEFGTLRDLVWLGDTLLAVDVGQRRLTMFAPDGRYLDALRLPSPAAWLQKFHAGGGRLFATSMVREGPVQRLGDHASRRPIRRYFRVDRAGGAEPLPGNGDPAPEPQGSDCESGDGRVSSLRPPFPDRGPLGAALPDGSFALAIRQQYAIDVIDPSPGSVVTRIERAYPALPVTDEAWRLESARYQALGDGGRAIRCNPPYVRPERMPVLRAVVPDDRGRLWAEVTAPSGYFLNLIDPATGSISETPMPARDPTVAPYAIGDRLYYVAVDADGVQSIQVLSKHR